MVGATAGEIVTVDGKVIGKHDGYEAFTIGQRKGLGFAMGTPHFVVRIEPESRNVVIGPLQSLERENLRADDANWLLEPSEVPDRFATRLLRGRATRNGSQVQLRSLRHFDFGICGGRLYYCRCRCEIASGRYQSNRFKTATDREDEAAPGIIQKREGKDGESG